MQVRRRGGKGRKTNDGERRRRGRGKWTKKSLEVTPMARSPAIARGGVDDGGEFPSSPAAPSLLLSLALPPLAAAPAEPGTGHSPTTLIATQTFLLPTPG